MKIFVGVLIIGIFGYIWWGNGYQMRKTSVFISPLEKKFEIFTNPAMAALPSRELAALDSETRQGYNYLMGAEHDCAESSFLSALDKSPANKQAHYGPVLTYIRGMQFARVNDVRG